MHQIPFPGAGRQGARNGVPGRASKITGADAVTTVVASDKTAAHQSLSLNLVKKQQNGK